MTSLAAVGRVEAQQPLPSQPPPTTISGFPTALPGLRTADPRPVTGPEAVESFIDSLGRNDAFIELVIGQSKILTTKVDIGNEQNPALIAVSDPSVVDYNPVSLRQIRITGQRIGTTGLSITTSDGQTHTFLIHVVADVDVLRAQLRQVYPDATLKLAMIRDHIVVEGQARDTYQVGRIMETIRAYLYSVQISQARKGRGEGRDERSPGVGMEPPAAPQPADPTQPPPPDRSGLAPNVLGSTGGDFSDEGTIAEPRVINLIRVPGPQQVLLKVRIAELNRTAFRQIGADIQGVDSSNGTIFGTQIGGANVGPVTSSIAPIPNPAIPDTFFPTRGVIGSAVAALGPQNTAFAIFQEDNFSVFFSALRRNNLLKILAEPNLVAMNGHQANFLAGGEFPVPVPQAVTGGAGTTVTVQFKPFGVRLDFVPFVIDGDSIRLSRPSRAAACRAVARSAPTGFLSFGRQPS